MKAHFGGQTRELSTDDVSYGGMFVRTAEAPPVRQLIRVEIPDVRVEGGRSLRTCAMVAHVVEPGNPGGRHPGMGIQLYGLGREDRVAWVSFVDARAAEVPEDVRLAPSTPLVLNGPPMDGPVAESGRPRLNVVPDDVGELTELYSRLVTGRAVIVASRMEHDEGEIAWVRLNHPASGRSFDLPLVADRQVRTRSMLGFTVALDDPDGTRAAALWRFISATERPRVQASDPLEAPFTEDEIEAIDFDSILASA